MNLTLRFKLRYGKNSNCWYMYFILLLETHSKYPIITNWAMIKVIRCMFIPCNCLFSLSSFVSHIFFFYFYHFSIFWENANFDIFFYVTTKSSWQRLNKCVSTYPLIMFWNFRRVSLTLKIVSGILSRKYKDYIYSQKKRKCELEYSW